MKVETQYSPSQSAAKSDDLLFLTDQRILEHIELLFFAYRSFTADPDRILENYGFGRAHHRAIHFINRKPGLRVSKLLDVLAITKQSLNRVLRTLIDEGYVESKIGEEDKRERNLFLTDKGRALEAELSKAQSQRLREAFAVAGPEAVAGFKTVLRQIIDPSIDYIVEEYVGTIAAKDEAEQK